MEPVFGTLTQLMDMRKINTIGIEQANKCMHMSAFAYNLKKYLKFTRKPVKIWSGALTLFFFRKWMPPNLFSAPITTLPNGNGEVLE